MESIEIPEEDINHLNLRKETQNFIVEYNKADTSCIDDMLSTLENSYNQIVQNLQQELEEKLVVEIHSDLKQLHLALGLHNAPNWIRGGLSGGKIIIASPLNPPPGSKYDNVVNTAVHEFVHMIVNKINGTLPRWLNEGIACYEAKDNDEDWIKRTIKTGIENNSLPTFKDLDTGDDFETFFKRDGYQYSYSMVEAIVDMYGYNQLIQLMKSPNCFVEILGITEDELHDQWKEYVKEIYR